MSSACSTPGEVIRVLVADSNHQSQLLVSALRRRPEFSVLSCALEFDAISGALDSCDSQVVVLGSEPKSGFDMSLIRRLQLIHPAVAKILLVDAYERDTVIDAFRSGVRGIFSFSEYPFRLFCKCVMCVARGQVWANNEQMDHLLEIVTQVPSLRVVNAHGKKLLTPREEQVVALVADGLTNRNIARELNLSEHTVKKYLFHIFDKLGISSRVELVLYAVNHGDNRSAEWIAGVGSAD
jgi:DNA-binding NarL/FixJ family response regulator